MNPPKALGDGLATIRLSRPLEWMDTDAAKMWHYTAAFRHVEFAELELHARLGIAEHTFGRTPRVNVTADFLAPARFGDVLTTTLQVAQVGRSSITCTWTLATGEETVATGKIVAAMIGPNGQTITIPDVVRAALEHGGDASGSGASWERG